MSIVIGVDPSSRKLAFVVTEDSEAPLTFTHALKHQDAVERCAEAYRVTLDYIVMLSESAPMTDIYVFIEEPVVGRGGAYATIVQSKVHGAIVAAFRNSECCKAIKGVNNAQWKKRVVGKGNAGKPDVVAWARQYWRQLYKAANNGKDQDLIDAGAINRFGHEVVRMMGRLEEQRIMDRRPLVRKKTRK